MTMEPIRPKTGPAAAAVLAAGIGSLALGVLALAADAVGRINEALSFWKPSGSLSGETSVAVVIWLLAWAVLNRRWKRRDIAQTPVNAAAFAMLALGMLLTFPPFMDLF